MADHPTTWLDIGESLVKGLPAIIAAITGLLCLLSSRKVNAKIDTNTEITKEVHEKVNGRVEQLITARSEVAHALGRAEGIFDEQQRQTVIAQAVIKQSAERTNNMTRLIDAVSKMRPPLDVLIVEDNEIDAILLHKILVRFNLRSETANTAVMAAEKLMHKNYGAIFADLDLQCPISRKGTLIEALKNNAPTTPIFVVTGYYNEWVVEANRILGVVSTIAKPATEEALGEVFGNLANRSV